MEHTTIAIDVAKSVFQVAVSSEHGSVDAERRLPRDRFLPYFGRQPAARIFMEACGSAQP
jgi:transposase